MATQVKINYNSNTGEILGYYPEDIEYSNVPIPNISVNAAIYEEVLHNEDKYRVQQGEIVDISNTAEYVLSKKTELISAINSDIESMAAKALKWGVINVDDQIINAGWESYYSTLQETTSMILAIKVYSVVNNKYYLSFLEKDLNSAKEFISKILDGIKNYKENYIPTTKQQYLDKLNAAKSIRDLIDLKNSISFGLVIDENSNPSTLK